MPVFILTDIEGSSAKWERHSRAMEKALFLHGQILRQTIESHVGTVIKHTGDGFFVVFTAGDALGCALSVQQKLQDEDWGELEELRVRIALNAGESMQRGKDYFGPAITV